MLANPRVIEQTTLPIYGHAWVLKLLQRTLALGGPRHAYLFLGPRHVGKSTLARHVAQTLLCTATGEQPCGQCRACHLAAQDTHPDIRWVQPRSKRDKDKEDVVDRAGGTLKTEQAAEIIHEASRRPLEGRYKVFVIQDMQLANDSFANKLLKTLEEPPDHVILLLTATDRNALLPTTVSRCQVIELRPLPVPTIEQALLAEWQADAKQATLLARLANGRLGWAVDQLRDESGATQRREQIDQLLRLVAADRIQRLALTEKLASGRDNRQLFEMLALWTAWWRDVLLVQAGCPEAISNIDCAKEIARHAAATTGTEVRAYLALLQRIDGYLHHTVNTRLALDVLFLRLPAVAAAKATARAHA